MESKILNSTAVQILLTENPSINLSAKRIINAFTISKNKPSVIIVIGKVNMTNIGLTNRFKIERTKATIIAVK